MSVFSGASEAQFDFGFHCEIAIMSMMTRDLD